MFPKLYPQLKIVKGELINNFSICPCRHDRHFHFLFNKFNVTLPSYGCSVDVGSEGYHV